MKHSRGFTLIELLVVIAIIGILSSVVLASLSTARAKGRDARRVSDIKQIQLALELYADQNQGKYPTALSSVSPTYIATLPTDPSTSASYKYSALAASGNPASCIGYHLGAVLEQSNPVLTGDRDATAGTACTGSATDFDGTSKDCAGAAGADMCFDVSNQ